MKKLGFNLMLAATLLCGGHSFAKPLPAELIMGNGRSWQGKLVRRDGDWVEFNTGSSAKPIRIGASTITEINFKVKIDAEKLSKMMRDREFKQIIQVLSDTIEPFSDYSDIPSNLTKYNTLLMEVLYRSGQYDKSLAISAEIAKDDRNPALQKKARLYQAMALIDAGRQTEVEALLAEYGWNLEVPDDAAPEKLYIAAKLLVMKGNYNDAMELVAKVVAFHSQNPDWMQPAEMLCAEIYTELGASNTNMYNSAEEVCRQILMLYPNTPEFDKAKQLQIRIEKLRAEQKLKESLNSEEA